MADSSVADSQPPPDPSTATSDPSQEPASNPDNQQSSSADTLTMNQERDLDAEINPDSTQAPADSNMSLDNTTTAEQTQPSTSDPQQQQPNGLHPTTSSPQQPVIEPRLPQKKDTSLRQFLSKMDSTYTPLIPDSVTDYYLTLAGLPPPSQDGEGGGGTDRRLARLLALATQKFVADVASDAYQYSRIRSTNTTSNNPLTGLGGAAGFGTNTGGGGDGGEGGGKGSGKKDAGGGGGGGKGAALGGPRAGYGGGGAGGGQGRTVLTMEDLGMAVGEYGVNVKRGEFYR